MILTQTEISPAMGGSAIEVTRLVVLITTLIGKMQSMGLLGSERWILTGIYLVKPSPTSCPILQTRFESAQSVATKEYLTLSSQAELLPLAWGGAGASIVESIHTIRIAIFLSLRRAIQIVRSLISR